MAGPEPAGVVEPVPAPSVECALYWSFRSLIVVSLPALRLPGRELAARAFHGVSVSHR